MTGVVQAKRMTLITPLVVFAGLGLVLFRLTDISEIFRVKATWAMSDFWDVVYYPVVAFLRGENPYDTQRFLALYPVTHPFPLYLPAVLLVHLPIGLLSAQTASTAYFALTVVLTFLLVFICLYFSKINVTLTHVFFLGGLLLLSRPGHWNLLLGQPTLQVVLASYVALHFSRYSAITSAIGIAVSMIKPTFGIPLATLMVAQGYVRPVLYSAGITIPINLFLLTALIYRAGGIEHFLQGLIGSYHVWQSDIVVNPALSIIAIDTNTFISHFIGRSLDHIVQLALLILMLGVASWTLRPTGRPDDERFQALSIGIVCLATLLSVHHQAYDLLLLTLPFIGLVYHRFPPAFYSSYRYGLSVGLLTILALNYASTHSIVPFVQPASGLWLVLVSINSTVLLVLFFLWVHTAHLVRLDAAAHH